jgi:hypothetical protein
MATKKLAKKAGLAVFSKHMENYKPADPYYEVYIDKKGREKRRRVSREVAVNEAYYYAYIYTAPSYPYPYPYADHLLRLPTIFSVISLQAYPNETRTSSRASTAAPTTSTKVSTFVVCALGGPSCSVCLRHHLACAPAKLTLYSAHPIGRRRR